MKMVKFALSTLFGNFKASKCKTMAKLAVARIKLLRNKREVVVKQMRRDIALLLQSKQDATARIRVEHVIREQNIMAANEIIELFCELIVARLTIISKQRECPADLKEGISSLIFASPRCSDIPELLQLRNIFEKKYGKEFVSAATDLRPNCCVNRTLIERLSVRTPSGEVKLKLMKEIAKEYQVEWDTAETEKELLKPPEELIEGPRQFVSATSMPVASGDLQANQSANRLNQSASSRVSNDREEHAAEFADSATAAKAAAESAQKAVAAAQAAAYLANSNTSQVPQGANGLSNGIDGLGNPLSSKNYVPGNFAGHSQSTDLPPNSQQTYMGNTHQVQQPLCFRNSDDGYGNPLQSKEYVHGNPTGSSQSNNAPTDFQDSVHCPDSYGSIYESQGYNRSHYKSNEQVNSTNLNTRRINRRHSYNAPAPRCDIKFDESDGSDSDCDEEIEMEQPSGEMPLPPNRPPPPVPASHAHQPHDRTRTDDSGYYRRHSLPRVHPKLPDYEELSARFEALKSHKP